MIAAFVALLVGPAFGTARVRPQDPMDAMHSMMSHMMVNCASEKGVGFNHPMNLNRCGESGNIPMGLR